MSMMKFPFEVPYSEVKANPDTFVDAVFSCLESEFLVMPKGEGFIEYPVFEQGYEALKRTTSAFRNIDPDSISQVIFKLPITLLSFVLYLALLPQSGHT